jgi:DNA-binding CsgD family transcriptional regulator
METINLTKRQKEILLCVISGDPYKVISQNLFITTSAISQSLLNAKKKNNCHSTIELAIKADRSGLLKDVKWN